MKKRIITLLAILAVMVACIAFSAQADAAVEMDKFACPCGAETHTWTTVTAENADAVLGAVEAGGHYHITETVDLNSVLTIPAGEVVILIDNCNLNLNGGGDGVRPIDLHTNSGAILHMIGYKANVNFVPMNSTTLAGGLACIGTSTNTSNALYLYGGLNIQRAEGNTNKPKCGGFFNLCGMLYIEASTDLGLPEDVTDPVLTGYDISNTSTTTDNNGGIIYVKDTASARMYMYAGTLTGGKADRGVLIYMGHNARLYFYGGTLVDGTTNNQGSICFVDNGRFYVDGATVQMNNVGASGIRAQSNGRIFLASGLVKSKSPNSSSSRPIDIVGSSTSYVARLYIGANMSFQKLDGTESANNKMIHMQSAGSGQYNALYIDKNWQGKVGIYQWKENVGGTAKTYTYGQYLGQVTSGTTTTYYGQVGELESDYDFVQGGTLHANAELKCQGTSEYMQVCSESGKLMFGRCLVVDAGDSDETTDDVGLKWFASVNEAVAEIDSLNAKRPFVRVAVSHKATIPAGKTVYVDLNGVNLTGTTVPDDSNLYIFDMDASYEAASSSTVTGTGAKPVCQAPDGKTYILVDGKCYPIKVTEAKLTGVTLRPSVAGIYFTAEAEITAAQAAKDVICTGVAVSLANIDSLANTAWTAVEGQTTANGILVQNILTDAANNAGTKINAEACVTYGEELIYLSGDGNGISLTGLMEAMDTAIGNSTLTLDGDQQASMNAFYAKWTGIYTDLWTTLTNLVKK